MTHDESGNPAYAGRRIVLLTQHGKERAIAPVMEPALGCHVQRVGGYDTDRLGSFTRDIPRAGSQLDAARKKARIGMAMAGSPLGLASEGSFGPDPMLGLIPWNVEMLVFLDDESGIEVVGLAQGRSNHGHQLTADWTAAGAFARQAGFPAQHLVVRPDGESEPRHRKGIDTWDALESAFRWAQSHASDGQVFLETDLRAHANPARMERIRAAAADLVARLQSRCPSCGAPGFGLVERIAGLPCRDCGAPTRETRADVYGCLKCTHRSTRERTDALVANPARCDYCNP